MSFLTMFSRKDDDDHPMTAFASHDDYHTTADTPVRGTEQDEPEPQQAAPQQTHADSEVNTGDSDSGFGEVMSALKSKVQSNMAQQGQKPKRNWGAY